MIRAVIADSGRPRYGSMSNCVETSTGWYKPQEHLSPVDFGISETVGDAF